MLKKTFKYRLFFLWSIYTGVSIFLLWLSWNVGILLSVFVNDPTKLTYLISLFYLGGALHCGIRSFYLSKQINAIIDIEENNTSLESDLSLPANFLNTVVKMLHGQTAKDDMPADKQLITDVFSSEARAQHEMGWFVASLLVKLGLLGTVIGFVLMLQPLASLESFDIADIQLVLANMTAGMSVALNTTLLGLITSMFLSFQYLLLDRTADELVVRTVHYMETILVPEIRLKAG